MKYIVAPVIKSNAFNEFGSPYGGCGCRTNWCTELPCAPQCNVLSLPCFFVG